MGGVCISVGAGDSRIWVNESACTEQKRDVRYGKSIKQGQAALKAFPQSMIIVVSSQEYSYPKKS